MRENPKLLHLLDDSKDVLFIEGWALIRGGRLFDNPVFKVGAYLKGAVIQGGS